MGFKITKPSGTGRPSDASVASPSALPPAPVPIASVTGMQREGPVMAFLHRCTTGGGRGCIRRQESPARWRCAAAPALVPTQVVV
ncbi:MAG: hypothetical protein ACXV5E_07330 [Halobacteriota archaeon]